MYIDRERTRFLKFISPSNVMSLITRNIISYLKQKQINDTSKAFASNSPLRESLLSSNPLGRCGIRGESEPSLFVQLTKVQGRGSPVTRGPQNFMRCRTCRSSCPIYRANRGNRTLTFARFEFIPPLMGRSSTRGSRFLFPGRTSGKLSRLIAID